MLSLIIIQLLVVGKGGQLSDIYGELSGINAMKKQIGYSTCGYLFSSMRNNETSYFGAPKWREFERVESIMFQLAVLLFWGKGHDSLNSTCRSCSDWQQPSGALLLDSCCISTALQPDIRYDSLLSWTLFSWGYIVTHLAKHPLNPAMCLVAARAILVWLILSSVVRIPPKAV